MGTKELKGIPAYVRADKARMREGLRAMREEVSGEPLVRAARGVLKELTAGRRLLEYVVHADCEAGMRFTQRIGLPESVARVVLQVHERWDGKGFPAQLGGDALEPGARVIAVADQVEIFHRLDGRAATREMLRRRIDGWFDPAVVEACERRSDDIFSELQAGSVWDAVLGAEPTPPVTLPDWRVDDLAQAVADVVDLKSPYFLGHFRGTPCGPHGKDGFESGLRDSSGTHVVPF